MASTELLDGCRMYFQQSEQSWKVYFSKWEALAKEENVDDCALWEDSEKGFNSPRKQKRKFSTCRKTRNKSIAVLNKKKSKESDLMYNRKMKKKCHGKKLVRKSKVQIIRKTENKTNLECNMLNIKYSQPDLKAIFIELLSENARNNEIFTILSRMFSENIDSLGSFSFSSAIMEKNEVSGNFVNKVNSEISHLDKISRRLSSNNETELKCDPCKSVRFPNSSRTRISDFQQSDYFELRERHGSGNQNLNVQRNYFETNSRLPFGNDRHGFGVNRSSTLKKDFTELQVNLFNAHSNKKLILNENETISICTEMNEKTQVNDHQHQSCSCAEKKTNSFFLKKCMLEGSNSHLSASYNTMPLRFSDRLVRNCDDFKICKRLAFESNVTTSFSRNVLHKLKNNDPSVVTSTEKFTNEKKPRKNKRSRSSNLFDFSDDSDDDEKKGKAKNPSRFLKIYCTPKRSRQLIKKETCNTQKLETDDSDGEDFTILDRIKMNKN